MPKTQFYYGTVPGLILAPDCGYRLKMANARRGNGFALLATIFILVILSTMAAVMAQLYVGQSKGALEVLDSAKAFAVADGGMRWIFQNQFDGDTDFTNNASPTGAPFGGTPVTMGEGQFWVEYANATSSDIDLKVTARVGNAVRVVQAHLNRTAGGGSGSPGTGPIPYGNAVGHACDTASEGYIQLTGAQGTVSSDLDSEGTIALPAKKFTFTGTAESNLSSHPFAGVDYNWFFNRKTAYYPSGLTITPAGPFPTSTDIWYVQGNLIFRKNGLAGAITMNGTVVVTGVVVTDEYPLNDAVPQIYWWPSHINIDADPALEWLPALVAGVNFEVDDSTSLELHGMACSGSFGDPGGY
ncbi:MAG: hypothetical protein HYZ93_04780 [Candidatus Omnitrophica bacterium]|nr:hypothetical protein [Candidatus Omnitrophota bacterium]